MIKYLVATAGLALTLNVYAGADFYEFTSGFAAANQDPFAEAGYIDDQPDYIYSVKTDILPQECRFYLTYTDSGKNNYDLLMDAEQVKDQIAESLAKIDKRNIVIEMSSFNPEQYLGSLFRSQKEEIQIQFRIIVKLDKDFWVNSKKITKVLDVINTIKKNGKLEKKLVQGKVTYAVESVEPFIKELLEKAEEKIMMFRKRFLNVNKVEESDLIINLTYNDVYVSNQTLEKVTLVLPYRFSYEIRPRIMK